MTGWTVIVNPNAGGRRGRRTHARILAALRDLAIDHDVVETERPGHAIDLARVAVASGTRRIAAVGGDGTAHEVANGILDQESVASSEVRLAVIPIGTGNDWGRTVGFSKDPAEAVLSLVEGVDRFVDAAEVRYRNRSGANDRRFLVNVAGMGYDAVVCERAQRLAREGRGGRLVYATSALACLRTWKAAPADLRVDGRAESGVVFSLAVGIGRCNGGGMVPCPAAEPDDGLLDLTRIGPIGPLGLLAGAAGLFDGSFVRRPEVRTGRGREIEVDAPLPLELDGEPVGSGPARFRVVPGALRVVVPVRGLSR